MTFTEILQKAGLIKNETVEENNSATRIGQMYIDVINFFNDLGNILNNSFSTAISAETSARNNAISAEVTARNLAITTAINNLKNGVPQAFDTLIEIYNELQRDDSVTAGIINTIAGKVDRTTLLSITSAPDPRALTLGQKYYDSGIDKICTILFDSEGGEMAWDAGVTPTNGNLYMFGASNYVWNGMALIEIGVDSGGGSGLMTVEANTLADFDSILAVGDYSIIGAIQGFYIGSFIFPMLKQMVIWNNKIYIRECNDITGVFTFPEFKELGADIKPKMTFVSANGPLDTVGFDIFFIANGTTNQVPAPGAAKTITIKNINSTSNCIVHRGVVAGDDGATEIKLKPFEVLTLTFSVNYGLWYVVSNIAKQEIKKINFWQTWPAGETLLAEALDGDVWYNPETLELNKRVGALWLHDNFNAEVYINLDTNGIIPNEIYRFNGVGMVLVGASKKDINDLMAGKTDKVYLTSVTSAPDIESIHDHYYNSETQLIYHIIDDGGLVWEDEASPMAGVIYICQGSNYMWNGVKLREVGATTDLSLYAKKTELEDIQPSVENPLNTISQTLIGGINELAEKVSLLPPPALCPFKSGANGAVLPSIYPASTIERTITAVRLSSNCSNISVNIATNDYDKDTLVGVEVKSGVEIIINDLMIKAGYNNANAIIEF